MTPTLRPLGNAFAAKCRVFSNKDRLARGCKLAPPVSLFPIGSLHPLDPLAYVGGSVPGLYIKVFSLIGHGPEDRKSELLLTGRMGTRAHSWKPFHSHLCPIFRRKPVGVPQSLVLLRQSLAWASFLFSM